MGLALRRTCTNFRHSVFKKNGRKNYYPELLKESNKYYIRNIGGFLDIYKPNSVLLIKLFKFLYAPPQFSFTFYGVVKENGVTWLNSHPWGIKNKLIIGLTLQVV
jgi:hypothetical protein